MYQIRLTSIFQRHLKKYIQKNQRLKIKLDKVMILISNDPHNKSLKTHKVNSKFGSVAMSSRVNNDLRIIWNFEENKIVILLIDIGRHSGKDKVYK